jgi:hypothetical protein
VSAIFTFVFAFFSSASALPPPRKKRKRKKENKLFNENCFFVFRFEKFRLHAEI